MEWNGGKEKKKNMTQTDVPCPVTCDTVAKSLYCCHYMSAPSFLKLRLSQTMKDLPAVIRHKINLSIFVKQCEVCSHNISHDWLKKLV